MTDKPDNYEPISCDYHDLLEVHATKRKPVLISYRDDDGTLKVVSASITDVFAKGGADYLSTSTGETVRLDQLVDVDGVKLAGY